MGRHNKRRPFALPPLGIRGLHVARSEPEEQPPAVGEVVTDHDGRTVTRLEPGTEEAWLHAPAPRQREERSSGGQQRERADTGSE